VIVKVGTRASRLALAMTALVTEALERRGVHCEIVTIRTQGDRHPDSPTRTLGSGVFVKDLEVTLAEGRIDLAVHSAKDLHGESTPGLVLAAFPPREDPTDVLVSRRGHGLRELPPGAAVGTESPRRRAFLLAARPDLSICGMRGNVDTRLRKLQAGDADAIVLAAAGLVRLGLGDHITERLETSVMLPEAGQGAIALQAREDAHDLRKILEDLDDAPTRATVEAERAFVATLGGTCDTAIAALAIYQDGTLALEGVVLDPDGSRIVRGRMTGPAGQAEQVGKALGMRLIEQGARSLIVGVAS
jgi:hydroxymethylbilane synthase